MRYLPSSVSQRGYTVSLVGGNPGRVALWPAHLNPVQPVGDRGRRRGCIPPTTGRPTR